MSKFSKAKNDQTTTDQTTTDQTDDAPVTDQTDDAPTTDQTDGAPTTDQTDGAPSSPYAPEDDPITPASADAPQTDKMTPAERRAVAAGDLRQTAIDIANGVPIDAERRAVALADAFGSVKGTALADLDAAANAISVDILRAKSPTAIAVPDGADRFDIADRFDDLVSSVSAAISAKGVKATAKVVTPAEAATARVAYLVNLVRAVVAAKDAVRHALSDATNDPNYPADLAALSDADLIALVPAVDIGKGTTNALATVVAAIDGPKRGGGKGSGASKADRIPDDAIKVGASFFRIYDGATYRVDLIGATDWRVVKVNADGTTTDVGPVPLAKAGTNAGRPSLTGAAKLVLPAFTANGKPQSTNGATWWKATEADAIDADADDADADDADADDADADDADADADTDTDDAATDQD
jgi:hypothetical protein